MFFVEILIVAVLLLMYSLRRPRRLSQMGDKLPGPPAYPFVGNALSLGTSTTEFYYSAKKLCSDFFGTSFRVWAGNQLYIVLNTPKDLQIVLGGMKLIEKADLYNHMRPWLGNGLLTNTGKPWSNRRKILTPTFHFKILEGFMDVFYANGEILVDCLQDLVGGPAFDIHYYLDLNTMDNICETAMGIKINAQKDTDSEYMNAVRKQADVVMQRSFKPWLHSDFIFSLTPLKTQQTKALKILHGTTTGVIKTRRAEMEKERAANERSTPAISEDGTQKRRLAFLDVLIQSTFDGSKLSDVDIREEVDTFMFEGQDTTAAAITYALWLLAWHQDIQETVVQELKEVWPDPADPPTLNMMQELKYMDRVIRETLRLFPSVPIFARKAVEDINLTDGLVAPKGSTFVIPAFMTHMDPETYPDPEKFDPDRFLPDNVNSRHPFGYIPFSAGPRNCIGQKFAMVEIKCTMGQILHKFKILPGSESQTLRLSLNMVLAAKDGVYVTIESRR